MLSEIIKRVNRRYSNLADSFRYDRYIFIGDILIPYEIMGLSLFSIKTQKETMAERK